MKPPPRRPFSGLSGIHLLGLTSGLIQEPAPPVSLALTCPEEYKPAPPVPRRRMPAMLLPLLLAGAGGGNIFGPPRARAFDIPRRGDRTPIPRNDAAHIAAAETKRQRKAARKS